jgi:integration host factor subunit alpha
MTERTITRADLVETLVKEVGLSRADSAQMLEAVLETIVQALERGETVKLARFGNFDVRSKRERLGRNPKTGVEATIAPRRVATFKASQLLKARVEGAESA